MSLPVFENSKPTNLKDDVQQAASRLESTFGGDFRDTLDQIKNRLNCKGSDYADKFLPALDAQLQADGKRAQVLQSFAQADFDALSHGNKRISSRDLNGAQIEFHNNGRTLEEHFTQQLADNQQDIEAAKHEHKFLFFGHKSGIDVARLNKYGDKEVDHNESSNMLLQYGPQGQFLGLAKHQSTTNGEPYITKKDIRETIDANDKSFAAGQGNQLTPEQLDALIYMEKNFGKLSTSVPDGTDNDGQQAYKTGITAQSMLKFASRRGTTPDSLDAESQFRTQVDANLSTTAQDYAAAEQAGTTSRHRDRGDCDTRELPAVAQELPPPPIPVTPVVDTSAEQAKAIADRYAQINDRKVTDTPVRDNWTRLAVQALRLDPASQCYGGGDCDPNEVNPKIDNLRQINGYDKKTGSYYGLPRRDLIRVNDHVKLWSPEDLDRIVTAEVAKTKTASVQQPEYPE
jgi:hypothetical protein